MTVASVRRCARFQVGELRTRRGRVARPAVAVANALGQVHEPGVDEADGHRPGERGRVARAEQSDGADSAEDPLSAEVHAFDVPREQRLVRRIRSPALRRRRSAQNHSRLAELDHLDQAAQRSSCRQDRRWIGDQPHRFHRLRHPRRIPLITVGVRLSAQRSPERRLPVRRRRLPQRQYVVERVIVQVDQTWVDVRMMAERRADDAGEVDARGRGGAPPHRRDAAVAHEHTPPWITSRAAFIVTIVPSRRTAGVGDPATARSAVVVPAVRITTADTLTAADLRIRFKVRSCL